MKVTSKNLARLDKDFKGFLEGDRVDAFFEAFGILFSIGHWSVGDFADRFAPAGYNSNDPSFDPSIIGQIKRIARAGIKGVEFHEKVFLDSNFKPNESLIREVRDALSRYKLQATTMNINMFTDPKWKHGSVTNADPAIRRDAIEIGKQAARIAKAVGAHCVGFWPGSDGWDYNFEVNYGTHLDHYISGLKQIADSAGKNGLCLCLEAKPKEPREGNMTLSTTAMGIVVAKTINAELRKNTVGIVIDYGHEMMYGVEPAMNVYLVKKQGLRLLNFHINSAKYKSNDEDRITGTGDNWQMADFCYAAIDTGYQGWFSEDQFTYRNDP